MTIVTLEDFDLDDRARGLVGWATRWDEFGDSLSCLPFFTTDRVIATLAAAARPFAHPLLDNATLTELLLDLRNAVSARDTYQTSGFMPEHLEDSFGDSYSSDEVEAALDADIDSALFPLLTGQSIPCHECKRIKRDVTYWQPATYGMRCEEHRLIVATHDGFGVGLVAS